VIELRVDHQVVICWRDLWERYGQTLSL